MCVSRRGPDSVGDVAGAPATHFAHLFVGVDGDDLGDHAGQYLDGTDGAQIGADIQLPGLQRSVGGVGVELELGGGDGQAAANPKATV